MRGRELDRSARRDVAAILKRNGLGFSGIDLWVPAQHFEDPGKVDRALEAVADACGLAAELARLVEASKVCVSVTLPEKPSASLVDAVVRPALSAGVRIADHNRRERELPVVLAMGFDPSPYLMSGKDPLDAATYLIQGVIDARLTDATKLGRCAVGHGDLDVTAYKGLLETLGVMPFVTVDVRQMPLAEKAVFAAVEAWRTIPR